VDAIHLHQQAEQRTFALHAARVTSQRAPAAANCIYLIDEDDAGRFLASSVEQAVHTRRSNTCRR
jgi:hypothetical protein